MKTRQSEVEFAEIDTRHADGNGSPQVLWDACDSAVFFVVDENGVNMADAQVRHLLHESWLYVDETDGYQIMSGEDVESLRLVAEKPSLGYDRNGEVVEL
jgi:hypothetical protein